MSGSVLVLNPRAGGLVTRGKGVAVVREARRMGAEIVATRSVEQLQEAVSGAAAAGVERVVVAGGDGTLHNALQALAGTQSALGVVPAGRGNDLARTLDVPLHAVQALQHALTAPIRSIDLGQVGKRWYACIGGVGFDGEVAAVARRVGKAMPGPFVYPWALLRKLPGFVPPHVRVEYDGTVWEGRTMMALFANGTTFGGGMRIAPQAVLDDGLLDLVLVREVGKLELLRVFPRVYRGAHVDHPAVSVARAREARVIADRPLVPWGDGEPLHEVPAREITFRVVPRALRVVTQLGMSSKSALER
ncbi:MAG TPA: diacylglycerol kinase family protein [Candidatus Polarisedimenticolaceae bacterium]|nr:diacylglycerol kinase family protein [Candidatus Polarisedimenticolaceae bacterium]